MDVQRLGAPLMAWPDTVRRADLRIDRIRGTGPGGQNRNKRDTPMTSLDLDPRTSMVVATPIGEDDAMADA